MYAIDNETMGLFIHLTNRKIPLTSKKFVQTESLPYNLLTFVNETFEGKSKTGANILGSLDFGHYYSFINRNVITPYPTILYYKHYHLLCLFSNIVRNPTLEVECRDKIIIC